MNKKTNLLVIILILTLPVLFYMLVKMPKEALSATANAEIKNKPQVLQFSQEMCSECRKLEEVMAPVKQQYKNKINFVKIDVARTDSKTQALIKKYKVRVVPTLFFIDKNGNIVKRTEGSMPASELKEYLDSICNG